MDPLEVLSLQYLGRVADHWISGSGELSPFPGSGLTPVFVPPLTTAEQATLADLQTMARFGVTLTLAEWQSIKTDAASLKTYNGIASPTLAQTVAATKAQNRILATIIRS